MCAPICLSHSLSLSVCLSIVLTHCRRAVKPALTSALTFKSWFQTWRFWRSTVKVQRPALCSPGPLTRGQSARHRADRTEASRESHQSWSVPQKGERFFHMSLLFSLIGDFFFHLKWFEQLITYAPLRPPICLLQNSNVQCIVIAMTSRNCVTLQFLYQQDLFSAQYATIHLHIKGERGGRSWWAREYKDTFFTHHRLLFKGVHCWFSCSHILCFFFF